MCHIFSQHQFVYLKNMAGVDGSKSGMWKRPSLGAGCVAKSFGLQDSTGGSLRFETMLLWILLSLRYTNPDDHLCDPTGVMEDGPCASRVDAQAQRVHGISTAAVCSSSSPSALFADHRNTERCPKTMRQ